MAQPFKKFTLGRRYNEQRNLASKFKPEYPLENLCQHQPRFCIWNSIRYAGFTIFQDSAPSLFGVKASFFLSYCKTYCC